MVIVHIGFDDIDSPYGGCTTHLVSKLVIKWSRRPWIKFVDYPNLIRLNPAIPWKTRGNGAVAVRIDVPDDERAIDLFEEAVVEAEEYIREFKFPESHPAIAVCVGNVLSRLRWLGLKAVRDLIPRDLLNRIRSKLRDVCRDTILYGIWRGLVGAYASIGLVLDGCDYTYELLAYRKEEYWGKPRLVDPESVKEMDRATKGYTFNNYDYETDKPLITPHGPDPVLLGIRGEEPRVLVEALKMLKIEEPVDMWVIYRTNQATDMHLRKINSLSEAYPYTGIIAKVTIAETPRRIPGGHVLVKVTDGEIVMDAAAYEPTGRFRDIVNSLRPGDEVIIYGVVRPPSKKHGPTINLEKINIVKLAPQYRYEAPKCPICGRRMKSMGRGKGYKCKKCGYKDPKATKIPVEIPRDIKPGWYQPPPRAFKHLMKPIERFGKEKNSPPTELYAPWHS